MVTAIDRATGFITDHPGMVAVITTAGDITTDIIITIMAIIMGTTTDDITITGKTEERLLTMSSV